MNCPVCAVELKIYVRQAIEVDYCPQCRGVWLDRGELDKIIEATQTESPPGVAPLRHADHHDRSRSYRDDDHWKQQKKHKKRGMLGELFDIFD